MEAILSTQSLDKKIFTILGSNILFIFTYAYEHG